MKAPNYKSYGSFIEVLAFGKRNNPMLLKKIQKDPNKINCYRIFVNFVQLVNVIF